MKEPKKKYEYEDEENQSEEENVPKTETLNSEESEEEENREEESEESDEEENADETDSSSEDDDEEDIDEKEETNVTEFKTQVNEYSSIDKALEESQNHYKKIKPKIEKLKKLHNTIVSLQNGKIFSTSEVNDLKLLYNHEKKVLESFNITGCYVGLNTAKELWYKKQKIMQILFKENLLTQEIVQKWDLKLNQYADIIEQLDNRYSKLFK